MTEPPAMTKSRRLYAVVAAVAGAQVIAIVVYLQVNRAREADDATPLQYELLSNGPALPDLYLLRADGSRLETRSLRAERVLLHFWATWCPPCREELPALLDLARDEPGLRVLAVSVDSDWTAVRAFFDGRVPPEVVRDSTGALGRAFEIDDLPDTYLLDRSGRAILRFAGPRAWRVIHPRLNALGT